MFDLLVGLVLTALLLRAAARLPERARVRDDHRSDIGSRS
jgi:hypothetical protein